MGVHKSKTSEKLGLQPGALIHVGEKKIENVRIRVIDYDQNQLEEREFKTIEECFHYKGESSVSWLNIDGLHDIELIEKVGENFGIHALVLEDILNTHQRPKIEDHGDYIFIISKMIYYDEADNSLIFEQFSFILGDNFVVTFQERIGDVFEPVRDRIRKSVGRIRKRGADYLTYALLDAIVDNYFLTTDKFSEKINILEENLMKDSTQKVLKDMYTIKRELLLLGKNTRPIREVVGGFERMESKLIEDRNKIFIRDLYDHVIDVNDNIDIFRDMVSGMIDTYLTITGNKMNEIMKVLTIMASIFIPLTFIAGIYGMNFDNMPELHKSWGYPAALSTMAIVAIGLIIYFKKKNWL